MPFDALSDAIDVNTTADRPLALNVRMPDGGVLSPPVRAGDRIMDALAAFGLPIRHDGEGAPCRSRIGPMWTTRVRPADEAERGILAALGASDGATRLLSRLVMSPDLDGLEIELPWDALVPQSYWVAG